MFKFNNLRRRVTFANSHGFRIVRIARQNTPGLYIWGMILSTLVFVLTFGGFWDAYKVHRDDALYLLPIFALVIVVYGIALAICAWGAFGVEEIKAGQDELCWTRTILRWRRTKHISYSQISAIRAVTPWHWMDNTVEITAGRKQRRIGVKLLRDEAVELAQFLRKASGLHE